VKNRFHFNARVLILPGLGNSGDSHWQTLWQKEFNFTRVEQRDWDTPICSEWVETIDNAITNDNSENIILVGHSLACTTIGSWAAKYKRKIKGALLVAPSDTEAPSYPDGTTGFKPMAVTKLHFPSLVITSTNDFYVTPERADFFAKNWGSELISIGEAGHINVSSGFGEWQQGLEYLKRLDS